MLFTRAPRHLDQVLFLRITGLLNQYKAWEGLDDFRRYDHERDDGSWSSRGNGSLAFFVRRLIATLRKILIVLLRDGNNISCSDVS